MEAALERDGSAFSGDAMPALDAGGAHRQYPAGLPGMPPDELALADLWRALVRRKQLILLFAATTTVLAGTFALLKPDSYAYTASLRIGVQPNTKPNSARMLDPIMEPEDVIAELKNVFIPVAIRAEQTARGTGGEEEWPTPDIKLDRPDQSRTIHLQTEGPAKFGAFYKAILSGAAQQVIDEQRSLYENERVHYQARLRKATLHLHHVQNETLFQIRIDQKEQQIDDATRKLEGLKDQATVLHTRLNKLETRKNLLSARIDRLAQSIKTASTRERDANTAARSPTQAMSLMVLGNQIQSLRDRLASTRETLQVTLPETRESLQKQRADNSRAQAAVQTRISRLKRELQGVHIDHEEAVQQAQQDVNVAQARLASVIPTRTLSDPMRSLKPVGIAGVVLIALGLILGLGAGVVLALLVDAIATDDAGARVAGGPPNDPPRQPAPAGAITQRTSTGG